MGGELVQLSLIFLGLAIVIVFAGNFMAKAADIIGEKSGMGASLAGLVLLAAATSLPEFAININAVRLPDSTQGVDLTLGNVLGSSLFNLLILGIVDLIFHSKARMFSSISSAHALSAMVSMALTAIVVLFLLLERDSVGIPLHFWHLGIGTIVCGLFYIFSVRLIYLDQHMAAKLEEEKQSPEEESAKQGMSLGLAIGIYLATTVVIFIAAAYLAPTADRIAEITGLGGTFIGSTLLALTTSLPEFVTTIVAVRIGAADMAIGNILGSNTFNIAILLPVDAVYTQGSLLDDASPVHAMTGVAVILLTCVATMGILYRAEKKYSIIEPDALLVVLMSLISIWGIYQLTRPTGEPEIKEEPKVEEVSYRSPVGCEQQSESHQMRLSSWMEPK
ncbi:hypothetical protein C5Y96_07820 [Blastopirellula marina]|uniref:Sodium/calcium exchanger membrane region domain-containing protein n=1 Tax=Blastopirellula marina TaxID=124 RepID=A0A2S8FY00_9BACT|nr:MULTISPECIES: sodium:calcium antiporter [Pirellulaceae]PQO37057.1 hypothetical protein C5Y96_07820 [Blastopirellula marina]RCS53772.1 sodium:calcium antiporter [Bremerella cremea]